MKPAPIRTITMGLAEPHPIQARALARAARVLANASARYTEAGYKVQTVRISTRPVFDDLAGWSESAILDYVREVQRVLDDVGIGYCSLGPAQVASPDFPLARLEVIADALAATTAVNMTVQLATLEHGLRYDAAPPAARVIKRLAQETAEGFGNFRFAVLACVAPGTPFFPAAYHAGPDSLSLGLQGAGIISGALQGDWRAGGAMSRLEQVSARVSSAVVAQAAPVVALAQRVAAEHGLHFGGIDLSPAPMGDDSIVPALEACGHGPIGSPGTLAAAATLTAALKQTGLPTCGYCGLMLPVLEDALLGKRWQEGEVDVYRLLLYSSVCGTGLDTVPLPGEMDEESIAELLLDVATLALRLSKPLSARLFPVPDKRPGEFTAFTSPYLTNTLVRAP
jgi:uncharacterized protein